MAHQRHDVLIGCGPDIDDVVAAFEPFIPCRVPEQPLGPFDDRDDLFAGSRRVTTDDMIDMLLADQICAGSMVPGDNPAGVAQVRR